MQQYYQVPNLKNYDMRRLARKSLKGKWGRAVLPMILITIAMTLPALVQEWELFGSGFADINTIQGMESFMRKMEESDGGLLSSILSFFSFLFTGAVSISAAAISIRVLRNEKITVKNAFIGFYQFVQGFVIDLLTSVFSALWAVITILPGMMICMMCCQSSVFIVLGMAVLCISIILYIYIILRYSMVYYIAQDNRTLPSLQVISYSVRLMKGRATKYFMLQLSFAGWVILSSIPIGAGFLFLMMASESESVMLKLIAICLILLGFLTVSMVQLYINTADGVFYSAVSGNFGLAASPSETPAPQERSEASGETVLLSEAQERQDASDSLEEDLPKVMVDEPLTELTEESGNDEEEDSSKEEESGSGL